MKNRTFIYVYIDNAISYCTNKNAKSFHKSEKTHEADASLRLRKSLWKTWKKDYIVYIYI